MIRLSLAVLLTLATVQVTPQHVYKNFPPDHKVLAEQGQKVKTSTEKPEPKPKVTKVTVVRAATQAEAQPKATTAPVVQPPAPKPQPVYGCGSDPNMAYIYQHESGCNTAAINWIGCTGLGQACPGSKLPCSLYDWNCQNNFFVAYAIRTYGSTYNAYIFWINHHWW